jgi:hypothetical protein
VSSWRRSTVQISLRATRSHSPARVSTVASRPRPPPGRMTQDCSVFSFSSFSYRTATNFKNWCLTNNETSRQQEERHETEFNQRIICVAVQEYRLLSFRPLHHGASLVHYFVSIRTGSSTFILSQYNTSLVEQTDFSVLQSPDAAFSIEAEKYSCSHVGF